MPNPFRRQPTASQDTLNYLHREAGAQDVLAKQRREAAREQPTASGRARLLGRADDAKAEAKRLRKEIKHRG